MLGQQNVGWKLKGLNTSINLHSNTALFTALFCIYWEMGTGEFQTFHLCENPSHAPANSNFILNIDSVWIGFQIPYSIENLVFPIQRPIHAPTLFLSPSLTTYVGVAGARLASSRASDDECACMGEAGKKPFPTNALVRLAILNIEVISLLLKFSHCAFHMVCFAILKKKTIAKCQKEWKNTTSSGTSGHVAWASYHDDSPRDFCSRIAYTSWRWFQVAFGYLFPPGQGSEGDPRPYETDPFPWQLSSTLLLWLRFRPIYIWECSHCAIHMVHFEVWACVYAKYDRMAEGTIQTPFLILKSCHRENLYFHLFVWIDSDDVESWRFR